MGFILGLLIGSAIFWGWHFWKINHDHDPDADLGWWTVVAVLPDFSDNNGERYSFHVQADNARAAEDLFQYHAQNELGGRMAWVCGVFEGKLDNADTYATFVDPDTKPTDWLNPGTTASPN